VIARRGVSLDTQEWREHIRDLIEELEAVAAFFDPLRDLTFSDLNQDRDTAPLMRWFRELCELPSRPAVVVIHHAGKVREGQRKLDRIRSSSALNQAPRSILFMSKRANGVTVEHLKCTDSQPHPTFAVETKIVEDPDHRGLWRTAHFSFVSLREAQADEAETTVFEFIKLNPGSMSTEVRAGVQAAHPELSPAGISAAIKRLDAAEKIRYKDGPRRSKLWTTHGSTGWGVAE
jgi:hypothetical protein